MSGEHLGRATSPASLRRGAESNRVRFGRLRHRDRFFELTETLARHASLWRSRPYRDARPQWCRNAPSLEARLLEMTDDSVARLAAEPEALIGLMSEHDPEISVLAALIRLPDIRGADWMGPTHRSALHIPGRKLKQIRAFASAMGEPRGHLFEWCSGKGHLGRLLACAPGVRVLSVDHDPLLCEEGRRLAEGARVLTQSFRCADVLTDSLKVPHVGHAVALHACGDLHVALIRAVTEWRLPALDISPCCYHKTIEDHVRPLSGSVNLDLSREERRMAVSDVATSSAREIALRQQEAVYRLGLRALLEDMEVPPRPLGAVPAAWIRCFETFCRGISARLGIALPPRVDWLAFEREGGLRYRRAARLSLARLAFRRPLEVWMALDRACYLEERGYEVRLGEFCARSVTPRNLLLSARAATG